jgi:Ala-tRNA(Pro) deacylase
MEDVLEILKSLAIPYTLHEHPAVYTVEEANRYWGAISGAHCKNLLLRNKKGTRHYLVVVLSSKIPDLKALTGSLGEDRLSFASPERLMKYLGLSPGSVSPFGLINDRAKEVIVILDGEMENNGQVNFHPNVNTATVGLSYADFIRFLDWSGNERRVLQFSPLLSSDGEGGEGTDSHVNKSANK